jgi:predicted transcriptional regulator
MAAKSIGMDGARALSAIRDRLQSRVPTAKSWIARYMAEVEGLSKAEIARKLHVSNVTVGRWLDGSDQPRTFVDPRQHKLPL